MNPSLKDNKSELVLAAIGSTVVTLGAAFSVYQAIKARERRRERIKFVQAEIDTQRAANADEKVLLPSIISHFSDFKLEYGASVEEANKRRTTKYYEMARDAHKFDLVPGIRSYPRLRNLREEEMKRIFRYKGSGKSHRTVIAMCDQVTSDILCEARDDILRPLNYSHDITTSGVWMPAANLLDRESLHVTIATPWWWHTIRRGNRELSQELVARFRQALVLEMHHAFQIELERIVLLGGKNLVALWRTVGEREAPDNYVIFDRHGELQVNPINNLIPLMHVFKLFLMVQLKL